MSNPDDAEEQLRQALFPESASQKKQGSLLAANVLNHAARLLIQQMRPLAPDRVGGFIPGADGLIGAVSALSVDCGCPMDSFIIRDGLMAHGAEPYIEGSTITAENRVAIVSNIVATGEGAARVVERLREHLLQVNIVGVYTLFDANLGGREALRKIGVPLISAYAQDDLAQLRFIQSPRYAIPDVRDGLKPLQRRLLRTVNDVAWEGFRKTCKAIDSYWLNYRMLDSLPVYETIIRMAQWYCMRYPLLRSQGNFGSISGAYAADPGYTECTTSALGKEALENLGDGFIPFVHLPDGNASEPEVLPAKPPLLLINGANGHAWDETTSIPPHNIKEICRAVLALLDNPAVTTEELLEIVPAPDFPTGSVILDGQSIHAAYETGHGAVTVQARCRHESSRAGRRSIVITEIPYTVPLNELLEEIGDGVRKGKIAGVESVDDLSTIKYGVQIKITIAPDADADSVLNELYGTTRLRISFPIRLVALHNGKPQLFTFKQLLEKYRDHRLDCIRGHIAVNNVFVKEMEKSQKDIGDFAHIPEDDATILRHFRDELHSLVEKYGDARRTEILVENRT